jgi:Type I phosphodiesterase / nucleotide pyrophosphatase
MPPAPPNSVKSRLVGPAIAVSMMLVAAGGGFWWLQHRETEPRTGAQESTARTSPDPSSPSEAGPSPTATGPTSTGPPGDPRVVVVSIDGLGSAYVTAQSAPTLTTLLDEGAGTLNARTERELTVTLPNHTGMVTGRPVRGDDGHGVTWNSDDSRQVRSGVESVFSTLAEAGDSSAVFAGKTKFEMWGRAWPGTIDPLTLEPDQDLLLDQALDNITAGEDELTFIHLAGPDNAGHKRGWGSTRYLKAVRQADRDLTEVADTVRAEQDVILVVTADHGGIDGRKEHGNARSPEDYTIPFVVWGPGVARGDLYELNPDYADPGTGRPSYAGSQPVRNGDVANLVTHLLGLEPVPGSVFDVAQDLTVTEP